MPKALELVGQVFGRLTVVSRGVNSNAKKATWNCLCSCGGSSNQILSGHLSQGKTLSCGCLRRENPTTRTHGMSAHPVYRVYHAAKDRCTLSLDASWKNYGGRGIQFKFTSFEQFWEEMEATYKPGLTLDRMDNDGHYEPGNVRWATYIEQANNRRPRKNGN